MNYFEHHIGDYAQATAHLSFAEDAAYHRMMRKYYAEEKPLPADLKVVQRLVGARTRDEKEAVQTVLEEFFDLRDDGWHQTRCDEEIAKYQDKQAKAKRSAEARWNAQRAQSEGNANASANAMRTHSEGNALQSPDTKHQTPEEERERASAPDGPSLAGLACKAMKAAGLQDVSPGHVELLALLDAGMTPEELASAAEEAVRLQKGFVYAMRIAASRRREAAAVGTLPPKGKPQAKEWEGAR